MSHEGFGRVVVFANDIVLCEKYFKDAHRFSFRTYEKLENEGERYLIKAQEKYNKYKAS
ncbi:MAG: NifX-associated nitrogen fixation protein [Campylobacterales bacterium]|nr:NifX-associated nitrogen fixation protein [Campylobacterales bacterium]